MQRSSVLAEHNVIFQYNLGGPAVKVGKYWSFFYFQCFPHCISNLKLLFYSGYIVGFSTDTSHYPLRIHLT